MANVPLGYCGLNCESCPVLIAKKNDDNDLRVKTATEYSELYREFLGGRIVKREDMNCSGCPSERDLYLRTSR
jgi:hypothetical protein